MPKDSHLYTTCHTIDGCKTKQQNMSREVIYLINLYSAALTATSFVSPCSKYSWTMGVTVFSKSFSSSGGTTVSYTQFSCQNNHVPKSEQNVVLKVGLHGTLYFCHVHLDDSKNAGFEYGYGFLPKKKTLKNYIIFAF